MDTQRNKCVCDQASKCNVLDCPHRETHLETNQCQELCDVIGVCAVENAQCIPVKKWAPVITETERQLKRIADALEKANDLPKRV